MTRLRRVPRMHVFSFALVGLLAFGGAAFAQEEGVELDLEEQNGSGITGTAMLEDMGSGMTRVTVSLDGAGAGPQPIHIHAGTCENLDPQPAFPLTNVMNGESITEVAASIADIQGAEHAINVHKSPEEAAVYVACGDIEMMAAGAAGADAQETPGAMTAETPGAMAAETPGAVMAETPGAMGAETPGAMMAETPGAMGAETPGAMGPGEAETPGAMMGETPGAMMAETPGAMGAGAGAGEGGKGPGELPASGSDTTNWLLVTLVGILGVGGLGAGVWLRRRGVEA